MGQLAMKILGQWANGSMDPKPHATAAARSGRHHEWYNAKRLLVVEHYVLYTIRATIWVHSTLSATPRRRMRSIQRR